MAPDDSRALRNVESGPRPMNLIVRPCVVIPNGKFLRLNDSLITRTSCPDDFPQKLKVGVGVSSATRASAALLAFDHVEDHEDTTAADNTRRTDQFFNATTAKITDEKRTICVPCQRKSRVPP